MKKQSAFLVLLIVTVFATGSTYGQTVSWESRDIKGFSNVNFGGSGDLFISFGPGYEVTLEGRKSDLVNTITELDGKKLTIRRKSLTGGSGGKIIVRITMPEIDGLGVSGSGKAEITDPIKGDALDLGISGSGRVLLTDLDLSNLDCGISGSGNVTIAGTGKIRSAEVAISGSGSYNGEGITTGSMEVAISGSGNCHCYVEGSLEAAISGSGSVIFEGSPKIDAKVSGSGRVRSK